MTSVVGAASRTTAASGAMSNSRVGCEEVALAAPRATSGLLRLRVRRAVPVANGLRVQARAADLDVRPPAVRRVFHEVHAVRSPARIVRRMDDGFADFHGCGKQRARGSNPSATRN